MPQRTKLLQVFPWLGGENTVLDPGTLAPNQLTQAANLIFGVRGSRKKRDGISSNWDNGTSNSASVIAQLDYWYGSASKTQVRLAVHSDKKVHSYASNGTKSSNLFAGTAWSSAITTAHIEVIDNLAVIAVDGSGNVMKKWTGSGNLADLGGTPPQASICRRHQGRLWTNDKTNLDRIQFSSTGNAEEWGGVGDSGAFNVGDGDGDPVGITAIFPTYKGDLFVAKKTKLYRITGNSPEEYQVVLVSNGIGCVSHSSIAQVDQDDMVYASERGFHSMEATLAYGDFQSQYLSLDIQNSFSSYVPISRQAYIKAAYLSDINSVAFAVTDNRHSATNNNSLWLYNIPLKSWYRWPNVSCESLVVVTDSDRRRFYLGTKTGRISQTFNGQVYDISESGTHTAITMTIQTGLIFVDQSPYTVKSFKRFALIYKPIGTHTITVSAKVDNYSPQAIAFNQNGSGDLLDVNFILDVSSLDAGSVLAPYAYPLEGAGRGIQLTISQSGVSEQAEIQGFAIEYELNETGQEVVLS